MVKARVSSIDRGDRSQSWTLAVGRTPVQREAPMGCHRSRRGDLDDVPVGTACGQPAKDVGLRGEVCRGMLSDHTVGPVHVDVHEAAGCDVPVGTACGQPAKDEGLRGEVRRDMWNDHTVGPVHVHEAAGCDVPVGTACRQPAKDVGLRGEVCRGMLSQSLSGSCMCARLLVALGRG